MKMKFRIFRKCYLALVFSIFYISVQANNIVRDEISSKDANFNFEQTGAIGKVIIRFFNISTKGPSTVTVNTIGGKKIFQESLQSKTSIAKKYDFSRLKPGKYVLTLESETKKISKTIIVGLDGSFREDKSHLFANFKPVVMEKKDQVQVMFENKTDENMKVRLMTDKGNVLFTEQVAGLQKYGRSIKTENLPAGTYILEVSCPDYYFTKLITRKNIR